MLPAESREPLTSAMQMLRALWAYRDFVLTSVTREFQGRYQGSLLGAFWAVIQPLAMIVIYTLIFAQIMRPRLGGHEDIPFAFSIYLCSGVITWGLFAEMLGRLNTVFIDNGNLLKKASFPRTCLPAIVTLSSLLNFAIILVLFLVFLAIIGYFPGWALLALLAVLVLQVLFTLGLGIVLGTLNVFFRDVGQFTQVVLQFWFWLTPIVYTASIVPDRVREMLKYNPMMSVIEAYQGIFLEHRNPDWSSLLPLAVTTLILLLLATMLFRRRVGEIVDEL